MGRKSVILSDVNFWLMASLEKIGQPSASLAFHHSEPKACFKSPVMSWRSSIA